MSLTPSRDRKPLPYEAVKKSPVRSLALAVLK
jgi:hypothetical protein